MKGVLLVSCLLAVAIFVHSEECPPEEDVEPCTCEEEDDGIILLVCYGEGTTVENLRTVLKSFSGKRNIHIELDEMNLGTLPSNLFEGLDVKNIDISHCELDSLQNPAFSGLENTLQELVILSSFTEDSVPAKLQLGHLRKLQELDLSFNHLTEVGDDWFQDGPVSLEYLTFSNNGIEKIGNNAFSKLVNLKELNVDGNRFGPIKRTMLPSSAYRLSTLELDNNALETLPEDIFSGMPTLKKVSLRNNGVAKLEQKTWEAVWQNLDIIYLEGNPVECDSHMSWLFNLRSTSAIYGTCHAPRDKIGVALQDFIDNRGQ